MSVRFVNARWGPELRDALLADASSLRIVCPFIKTGALKQLLEGHDLRVLQVITRFNLADFAEGVSDIAALRLLLRTNAQIRGIRKLHSKLYLFGANCAIITSANLTRAALDGNHEFGIVSQDPTIIAQCDDYFETLWRQAGDNLAAERLNQWEQQVTEHLARGARPGDLSGLDDEGVDVGTEPDPAGFVHDAADSPQAFVKFLGEGNNRVPLSFPTIEEIDRAGCHWALAYPASKRPSGVDDGALMFIARLTENPTDIRVFGRATGLKHLPGRDDASAEDTARRTWKQKWSRYIRVHHAEFVAGTMANGVSLNELMQALGADSFASTQRNAAKGEGNTNPRRAFMQQAAVELSARGLSWLTERLDAAFGNHGKVPADDLAKLDWP